MDDETEIKIAAGVLSIYGLIITSYTLWSAATQGLGQMAQIAIAGFAGTAFTVSGAAAFRLKKWGLYSAVASIVGAGALAAVTDAVPGGALPVLFMLAILWDIYKNRHAME